MVRGVAIILLLLINLTFWGVPVTLLALGKFFMLDSAAKRRLILTIASLADAWVGVNNRIFDAMLPTEWDVAGVEGLRPDGHYLIISNHVSWVDIFALFRVFHRRAPFIRFFLKHQLIWFPIVGQACWALEFPFMRRYSAEYLQRHPEKRGRDLETTRRACRRFRRVPVAILSFVEGTRFTREKQADQESPYKNLLRPRIGGIAFVLASLGDQLEAMIDVTLAYPHGEVTFWEFVTGRIDRMVIRVRQVEVPPEFFTPAATEPGPARDRFKAWVDELWRQKDALYETLR